MKLTSPAIVLDVPDIETSKEFVESHLAFYEVAVGDRYAAFAHDDVGFRLIFAKPAAAAAALPAGLQIGFVVEDIDAQWEKLKDSVQVGEPIQTLPSGERYFQIIDPNGVLYRLVQWVDAGRV